MLYQNLFTYDYRDNGTQTSLYRFVNYILHPSSIRKISGVSQEGRDMVYSMQVTYNYFSSRLPPFKFHINTV